MLACWQKNVFCFYPFTFLCVFSFGWHQTVHHVDVVYTSIILHTFLYIYTEEEGASESTSGVTSVVKTHFYKPDPSNFIASFWQYHVGLVVVGTFLKIRGSRPTSFTLVKDFTVVFIFDSASKCDLYIHVGWVLCFSDCADGIFPKTKRKKNPTILTRVGIRKTFFRFSYIFVQSMTLH